MPKHKALVPGGAAAVPADRPAVVHVAPDPHGRGGMAAVVHGLLTSSLAARYELESITMHRSGSAWRRVVVALWGLVRLVVWCGRNPRGVVHVHAAVRGSLYRKTLAVLAARMLRRPVLVQVHAGPGDIAAFAAPLGPVRRGLIRAALLRAQSVVSVSEASAAAVADAFGLQWVGVIRNAAPIAPPAVAKPVASTALYLGGFEDPAKGGLDLLTMLPALLDAVPVLDVVLAGPGEPPAPLTRICPQRIKWRGWLDPDAKHRALSEAGIVLLPSRSEGLPVVLLEAMAYGRAVVATSVGGIPELLRDGIDGILVPPGEPEVFASAVARLARDPACVARLGDAARERVGEFDEARTVALIDATYRELLQRADRLQ